ncbi:MAG: MerR family transcriptional regulator [Oscillospiraceae bacterium]|nr:MerR family transcriptional regulator [Oscillospiraceae bacterium]
MCEVIFIELIRINDVVDNYGISSRTLRYYEQVGILRSVHPENKAQRYYDETALDRLKQIIVLRKFQIPIKDIIAVFKDDNMTSLIQTFMDKLNSLDNEISALTELRRIIDDFLHKMMINGIKKISAITLLYEETEKRLVQVPDDENLTFEQLSQASRKVLKLHDVRIIRLMPSRMLTSQYKSGGIAALDADKMQNLFAEYDFIPQPGLRNCFYRKETDDEWIMMIKIPDDYENNTPYTDEEFTGGLFAVASSFMEDMDDTFILLKDWIAKSGDFEIDTNVNEDGIFLRKEMIEEILPYDIAEKLNRYQQDIFIPVKNK